MIGLPGSQRKSKLSRSLPEMEPGFALLLSNALVLGFRHGVDWDHLAAIMDIVGSAGNQELSADGRMSFSGRPLNLALLYALGHAFVVVCLGFMALVFAAKLPEWVDPIMERLVGATLVILSCWLVFSLFSALKSGTVFKMQSRWMLLFAYLQTRLKGAPASAVANYDARSAFGVGMIHGIGAETGSQILLIAGLAGLSSHFVGIAMMLAFVSGLIISNGLLSLICCAGFRTSSALKPLYLASSLLAALFSFLVGSYFLGGCESLLPDLQKLF